MELKLSERQRITVAAAITIICVVVIFAAVGALLYVVGAFFARFSSVFLPVAVAGVIALVLKPYYDWLCSGRRMPRLGALVLTFASILVPIMTLGWFFGAILVEQSSELLSQAPGWWEGVSETASGRWPQFAAFLQEHPVGQKIRAALAAHQREMLDSLQTVVSLVLSAGAGAVRRVGALFTWAVLPIYVAFLLMASPGYSHSQDYLPFLKPETRQDVIYLMTEFVHIIVAFFRGQLLIALLQGMLFAIGFSLVGLQFGLLLGLLLGFLNIIPYLGSIVGLVITLPLALFQEQGGRITLVLVLIVFVVVQTIEGYVLTPKIMGQRTGLHPMTIMIAIFFWGSALGGISGMILAIPLTAFLVVFWRLAREKYIRELV